MEGKNLGEIRLFFVVNGCKKSITAYFYGRENDLIAKEHLNSDLLKKFAIEILDAINEEPINKGCEEYRKVLKLDIFKHHVSTDFCSY